MKKKPGGSNKQTRRKRSKVTQDRTSNSCVEIRSENKQQIQLSGAEKFLISKYMGYIALVLRKLANRDILYSSEFEDASDKEQRKLRDMVKEEVVIDIISLYRTFVENTPIPEPDLRLFMLAIQKMSNKPQYGPISYYVETFSHNNKLFLRVIF